MKCYMVQIADKQTVTTAEFPWSYVIKEDPIDWFINWCSTKNKPSIRWVLVNFWEITEEQYNKLLPLI